jgi:hypothetical protein
MPGPLSGPPPAGRLKRELEPRLLRRGPFCAAQRPHAKHLARIVVIAGSAPAEAKGCLKGAVVGGAAGHVAGHHGVLGAAAGCLVGRHRANKQAQQRTNQMPAR